MKVNLSPLSIEQFLSEYWQQKPVVIKAALNNFIDPIDADTLAGLATEAHIESRIIRQPKKDQWQAESGPFSDFTPYGKTHWTLVVQSVNHWVPAVQAFARQFDFIPQWRFDDIMVSYATPHGGVGPHIDRYDVFICQGVGQRHWKVGDQYTGKEVLADEKLRHVGPFTPIIDTYLNTGDLLYIPPGFPHEGISLDASMSFSVGYKSTNATELVSGFADYLIDFIDSPALLCDINRQQSRYGQIDTVDLNRIKAFLKQIIEKEPVLCDFLGRHYSRSLSELDIAQTSITFDTWLKLFTTQPLKKLPAVKMLYLENNIAQGLFYVDGEQYCLKVPTKLIRLICDCTQLSLTDIDSDQPVLAWLWQSTNQGYWYFED